MPKNTKTVVHLECAYTEEELATKRDALADATLKVGQVELDKSNSAKAFKEQLDALYADGSRLSHQIKRRGETRPVDCTVQMNNPRIGEKTTIRLDTGEMVKVEMMTDSERQEEIDFDLEGNRSIEELISGAHKNPPTTSQGAE